MPPHGALRIEPSPQVLDASRQWIEHVRSALGHEFLAAYLTGSVLLQGFDLKHSRVNILVVARRLGLDVLDALRDAIPATRTPPHFDPLFLTRTQIDKSLDAFPVEWLDIQERHLRIEGEDIFTALQVPRAFLRLQCEHELRGKHILIRQAYLAASHRPAELGRILGSTASSFAASFRTLLRLRGEIPPADTAKVIERVSDSFGVDARGLLGAHLVRYSGGRYKADELLALYRRFLTELDRLVIAIDQLQVT
jgi:hypothetical protein